MRRLCFGGSFNPIHHGHLICARAVAEAAGFDQVVIIPNAISPLKLNIPELASPTHRLAMCRLAVQGDAAFEVDDVELSREGPSYTIDTIRAFRGRGWPEVHWLIGADMVNLLPKWHEPDALLNEATFVVMARPGHAIDWASLPQGVQGLRSRVIEAPLVQISATHIRRRIAGGFPINYLTPPAVCDYITRHGLYR
jgi:nicotinate-nucleotide adenylyltransferase